ncbi:unnamed protein product [Brachionus calyciflorus]|uniref:Transglutaminase-like domain-containing protein n=1 Tax=Brachionus calyciflorus TaxID=104777 RepID=A0A814BU46_9BILA|nr:unnamed protein product [Brachionus calyciflorus]
MCRFFCCCCPCISSKPTVEPIPEPIILKPTYKRDNDEFKQWIQIIKLLSENMKLHNYISSCLIDFKNDISMKNCIEKAPCETLLEKIFAVFLLTKKTELNSQETAKMFAKLCSFIKVESKIIHGYAKNGRQSLTEKNHFWNAFEYKNLFYYVDVKWAKEKSSNYYFMTPPEIFVESHFSLDFFLHKQITFHEFENLHQNELEFHVIGLKHVQPIRGSIINCYSNPFYFEYTCDDSVELTAKLYINEYQVENGVVIQTDMSSKPFKYCVFFFLNDKDKTYTLDLFGKSEYFKTKKLLSRYYLKKLADVFPTDLPKYNLISDSIKCLSHDCLLVKSSDNMTNFEFSMPLNTKMFGVLKNLDEKQQVDLPVIAQYIKKESKFMVIISR